MNETRTFDREVLLAYLSGAEVGLNREVLESWFSDLTLESELNKLSYERWEKIIARGSRDSVDSKLLDRVHHRINLETYRGPDARAEKKHWITYIFRAASILLIPLLAVSITFQAIKQKERHKNVSMVELYSPAGSRTQFTLPDGSSGWLRGGSTLTFPDRFGEQEREVNLLGEAYFNIENDGEHPFLVRTDKLQVKVSGTRFNVVAWEDVAVREVTLVSGSVEILRENLGGAVTQGILLKPGDHCSINIENGSVELERDVNVYNYISWTEGKLVFRNEPLRSVMQKLENWYGVDIEIRDEILLSHTYRATFEDETLEEVLEMISLTTPINFQVLKEESNESDPASRLKVIISNKK